MEFEKQSKSTNITKQKQSHRFRVQIGGNQKDRKWAEDGKRWRLRYKFSVTKSMSHKIRNTHTHTHTYIY